MDPFSTNTPIFPLHIPELGHLLKLLFQLTKCIRCIRKSKKTRFLEGVKSWKCTQCWIMDGWGLNDVC